MHKIIIAWVLIVLSKNSLACFPQEWSLERKIETSTKIALVEVVALEAKEVGKNDKYELRPIQVEVVTNIDNTVKGDLIYFLDDDGFLCGNIEFDRLGQRAIIFLKPAPHKTLAGKGYYLPVNLFSVHHVVNGKVSGLSILPLSTEDAIEKLKQEPGGANSSMLYLYILVGCFLLFVITLYLKKRKYK